MQGITSLQILNDDEGRWGNQLFRIGTIIGYSKKHNYKFHVPADWKHKQFFESTELISTDTDYLKEHINYQFCEDGFHYQEIPKISEDDAMLELIGYYQSYKYFDHAKAEVLDFFTFKSDIVNKVKQLYFSDSKVRLSVHIRHGDYYDRSRNKGQQI